MRTEIVYPAVMLILALSAISAYPPLRKVYFQGIAGVINKIFLWIDNFVNSESRIARLGLFNTEGHSPFLSILVGVVLAYTIFGPTLAPLFEIFDKNWWGSAEK